MICLVWAVGVLKASRPIAVLLWVNLEKFCQSSPQIPLYTIRGRVFSACVGSAMLHGGEAWAPNVFDLQLLQRNDCAMVRWIYRGYVE